MLLPLMVHEASASVAPDALSSAHTVLGIVSPLRVQSVNVASPAL